MLFLLLLRPPSIVTHLTSLCLCLDLVSTSKLIHNERSYEAKSVKQSENKTVERVNMLISEPSRAAQFLSLVLFRSYEQRTSRATMCRREERLYCTVLQRVASCTADRLLTRVVILAH